MKTLIQIFASFGFIALLLSSSHSRGQKPSLLLRNITINDGLSQNSVIATAVDSAGFVWMATQDGLNRYNGTSFLKFPVRFDDVTTSSSNVLGKLAASKDRLWMITKGGKLEALDLLTNEIVPIVLRSYDNKPLNVTCILVEQENLWIGTTAGLYFYDLSKQSAFYVGEKFGKKLMAIQSLARFTHNSILAIADNELFQFDTKSLNGTLIAVPQNKKISTVFCAANGEIWLGTFGGGILIKEPSDVFFKQLVSVGEVLLPDNLVVYSLVADRSGRIWAGTYGSGLYVINRKYDTIRHLVYDSKNVFSLGFNDVLSLTLDELNGVWIGTDGGGVSYYNEKLNIFTQIVERDVPENISIQQIRAIAVDKNKSIWLGTSGKGLSCINLETKRYQTFHLQPFKKGIQNYDRIVSLYDNNQETIWVGTQGNGLLLLNKSNGAVLKWFHTEAKQAIPDNTIWNILPESENQLWLATRSGGLCLFDKKNGLVKQYSATGEANSLAENSVQVIVKGEEHTLFLGLENNGIQIFDKLTKRFSNLKGISSENILANDLSIKSLYYTKPFLLAGTAGKGLLLINTLTGYRYLFDESNGLPNSTIYSIVPEGKSIVWVSTNKGLARVDFSRGFDQPLSVSFKNYTVADGLQSNEFNTGAAFRSTSGMLLFGGIKGLNFFYPLQTDYSAYKIPVFINSMLVDNIPLELDTLISFKKNVELKYKQNSIAFNYSAIDFLSPGKVNYAYQLDNYDKGWVNAGDRTYVAYTNLPPGNYKFRVRIHGSNLSDTVTNVLSIYIRTPFWMRWWFIAGAVLLLVGIIYGLYRYRINQLLHVQQIRNRISADLHDDIGSRLTNIQLLSAISNQQAQSGEKAAKYFQQIDEQVQSSAEALDEIVWNMKIKDYDLDNITARLRRYASEVLEMDGINYSIKISDEFDNKLLSMEKRRDLFLVFREILNNIRKHAEARNVSITIQSINNLLVLNVEDDGKGFDALKPSNRNGLNNMKDRVERWKGAIYLNAVEGKGTSIEIKIPFDKISLIKSIFSRHTKH